MTATGAVAEGIVAIVRFDGKSMVIWHCSNGIIDPITSPLLGNKNVGHRPNQMTNLMKSNFTS